LRDAGAPRKRPGPPRDISAFTRVLCHAAGPPDAAASGRLSALRPPLIGVEEIGKDPGAHAPRERGVLCKNVCSTPRDANWKFGHVSTKPHTLSRHPKCESAKSAFMRVLTRYGASRRKSAVADLRTLNPISGKPEIGGRRPGCRRGKQAATAGAVHPSRRAKRRARQDDGLNKWRAAIVSASHWIYE
jgi:hypothetical protein